MRKFRNEEILMKLIRRTRNEIIMKLIRRTRKEEIIRKLIRRTRAWEEDLNRLWEVNVDREL